MAKKIISIISLALIALLVVSCGSAQNSNQAQNESSDNTKPMILKVGASPVPHAEILNVVKPILAEEGIELQIVEFADYNQPNLRLADKDLDANYFQHIPYLESFSKEHKLDLTYTAKVHIEPMGVYSEKVKNLSELKDGAEIAIPNDPTNGGRALILLQQAGLLKIKDGVGINATVYDIAENPKNLKITELEAATLPRVLGDVDAAVINSNYALEAKLVPTEDALVLESPKDNPYVNILAVRKGDENRPEIVKLSEALNSPEVKKFIEEEYKGAVIPAFE
ncbi:MAG TPA: ABC transporter substrate-binding protein [Thermoanaerobacterales bacterium]|uniref:MetQ/NlpA family ABC transporter substrate-binding protein n=1 Tax=Tepidanaerobacter sp. GT38 TaxID=2722793 RepID=UPI0017D77076|nr:MetQ/NlpA family ABC transporter substrate-binding protein [Tepidanaerobacter sp. GT38]MCG1013055.1 MetQ/NlpA family ABC transporter substrate-binding protein [Tepidanaerobacter sp. GT38]HHY42887.1 ABC transporter substrate-binding protein [Thermoanaerobacterales bacterium]